MNTSNISSDDKSTKEEVTWGKALLFLFLSLASLPLTVVLNGVLLRTLWLWFAVPLGLPAIGGAHAMGLAAMVTLAVVPTPTVKKFKDKEDKLNEKTMGRILAETFAVVILRFGITYLLCWFYHGRMVS